MTRPTQARIVVDQFRIPRGATIIDFLGDRGLRTMAMEGMIGRTSYAIRTLDPPHTDTWGGVYPFEIVSSVPCDRRYEGSRTMEARYPRLVALLTVTCGLSQSEAASALANVRAVLNGSYPASFALWGGCEAVAHAGGPLRCLTAALRNRTQEYVRRSTRERRAYYRMMATARLVREVVA